MMKILDPVEKFLSTKVKNGAKLFYQELEIVVHRFMDIVYRLIGILEECSNHNNSNEDINVNSISSEWTTTKINKNNTIFSIKNPSA